MSMQAVVVDPGHPERLTIQEVAEPTPRHSEVLVRVSSFSLNLGEVRNSMQSEAGIRPGWDLAGTIVQAASDESGPPVGTRVVGFSPAGSWAELIALPSDSLTPIPDNVSFAQAACLPVAGLTALHAVERGSGLIARKVLVTGASGGVGLFACQLAKLAGARVIGLIRNATYLPIVQESGAEQVIISEDAIEARTSGPYRLIIESVGGRVLSRSLEMLSADGVCVAFGATAGSEVTFDLWSLAGAGRANLYGLVLFNELAREPAAVGLERLVYLVATQQLRPHIAIEESWHDIGTVARQLLDRRFAGKAVLHITE